MNNTSIPSERLGVVDSLRGFALLAIVVLHSLEHYNLYFTPSGTPEWLQTLDIWSWESAFFMMAGKAYALFSLLFGFSFYIQLRNAQKRGENFRWRFVWRMCLLFLFAQVHALMYNGDILVLYAVVGLILPLVAKLKDRALLIIAVVCLLQPIEWLRVILASNGCDMLNYGEYFLIFAKRCFETGIDPATTLSGHISSNIWEGQLYSNLWQAEHGRILQSASLFIFGMLLGRRNYFMKSETSVAFWRKALTIAAILYIPTELGARYIPGMSELPAMKAPLEIIFPMLRNFVFMIIIVSGFTLLWFRKGEGYKWQSFIKPYGRMSLTNYIIQSYIGVTLYYSFGFGLYEYTGAFATVIIGLTIVTIQWFFSRWWLSTHKQGPFEWAWKKLTWIDKK